MNYIIGIDGGGTKTVGLLADGTEKIVARVESGPSNYHVVGAEETKQVLETLISELLTGVNAAVEDCAVVCLGMAGLGRPADREVIGQICDELGIRQRRILTHDAQIALIGGAGTREGVIVISGTGSIVYGLNAQGEEARAGGWGHILGDEGSGYDIALRGLRAVVRASDARSAPTELTGLMLETIGLQHPNDLIRWVHNASKDEVAGLATQVFVAADLGDSVAQQLLRHAADELALAAKVVIDRLRFNQPFNIVLSGGIFTHQQSFVEQLDGLLKATTLYADVTLPQNEPAYGAVLLGGSQVFNP